MYGLNRDTGANLILVKTALDKLRDDQLQEENVVGKATALDPLVFTQDSADKAAVVTSVLGGGGYFEKNTDDFAAKKHVVKNALAPKTTLIAEFNQNLGIARTFMADQQQSAVAKSVRQATRAWTASRDRNAFGVYALGFTTQTTIDSVALFSNSHINANGDTVDNLETGVLTNDNLNVVVNSLRQQVDNSGVKVGYEPKFLLTPSLLHQAGMQVAKSVLRAGTGNNDLNYWSEMYPGMKVVYSPHLDSTSTTAYFVGTSQHDVIRFEREAFFSSLVDWRTDPSDQYLYKMRAREEVDSINYTGLIGSSGTV
jgi:hypothetical protein